VPSPSAQARSSTAMIKNKDNLETPRGGVSEIKLKRTDTTLDLSLVAKRAGEKDQKTEREGYEEVYLVLEGEGEMAKRGGGGAWDLTSGDHQTQEHWDSSVVFMFVAGFVALLQMVDHSVYCRRSKNRGD
jgi:hypothetical protein